MEPRLSEGGADPTAILYPDVARPLVPDRLPPAPPTPPPLLRPSRNTPPARPSFLRDHSVWPT